MMCRLFISVCLICALCGSAAAQRTSHKDAATGVHYAALENAATPQASLALCLQHVHAQGGGECDASGIDSDYSIGTNIFSGITVPVIFRGSSKGAVTVTIDLTIPANVAFRPNGIWSPDVTRTLTIHGGIDNPGNGQIFGGAGSVKINPATNPVVLPEWFGASNAVQKAINSLTANGTVLISASCVSTEAISNPGNYTIIDLRRPAELGIWSQLQPTRPVANYPLGNDLSLSANGPADLYLEHNKNTNAATTTATALAIGANNGVLVGSTANFAPNGGGMYLRIGRGTANEEVTTIFAIVDGTHFDITCAKTHGPGTTDIEQLGSTIMVAKDIIFDGQTVKPSQQTHGHQAWYTRQIDPFLEVPNSAAESWPAGGLSFRDLPITGQYPTGAGAKDLFFRNYSTGSKFLLRNFANTFNIFDVDNTGLWNFYGPAGEYLSVYGATTVNGPIFTFDSGADTGLRVKSTNSGRWYFTKSNEPADEKSWQIVQLPGLLAFQSINDAENVSATWMQVNRGAGNTIDSVAFPAGGGIVFGAATGGAQGAGTLNVSGGIYKNGVAYPASFAGYVQGAAGVVTPGQLAVTSAAGTIADSMGLSDFDEGAGISNLRTTASTYAKLSFNQSGGAANEKKWQFYAQSGGLILGALNDAENAQVVGMEVHRGTGTAITSVEFPSAVNMGSAQVGTTEIVSSARVLHNVTANAGIIASGTVDAARLPQTVKVGGNDYLMQASASAFVGSGSKVVTTALTTVFWVFLTAQGAAPEALSYDTVSGAQFTAHSTNPTSNMGFAWLAIGN